MNKPRTRLTQRRRMLKIARAKAEAAIRKAITPVFARQYKRLERFLRRSNLRKKLNKIEVPENVKGDFEGHPFRGNQWTGNASNIKVEDVKVGDVFELHANDILTSKASFDAALRDHWNKADSKTRGPLSVYLLPDKRFLLTDGQHRFAEGVSRGQRVFRVKVEGIGEPKDYATPMAGREFNLATSMFRKQEALYKVQELFKAPSPPKSDHDEWENWKKALLVALLLGLFSAVDDIGEVENDIWSSRGYDRLTFDPETIIEDYQRRNGYPLKEIGETTLQAIQNIISDWYMTEEPFPDLLDDLKRYFNETRVNVIARQEVGNVISQITFQEMMSYGLNEWYWDAMGENPCDSEITLKGRVWNGCKELNGHIFDLSVLMPPAAAHPNCECLPTPKGL